ncbi:MAG: helix-turn-helix transcriptional regulator [Firmicutes bacterium]|nr:helix-turn-helix transcriptional regulator [Bacillota bacterium]
MDEVFKKYFKNPSGIINYSHSKTNTYTGMDFHLHEFFEIYFFISGNVNYFIENKVYHLKYGDLLIMNNHEIHRPSISPGEQYERIVIHFDPSIVQVFSSPGLDLISCFVDRPKGEYNRVSLNKSQIDEIQYMLSKVGHYSTNVNAYCSILKFTAFIELLVNINKIYNIYNAVENKDEYSKIPEKLASIIDFIDKNPEKDLSLQALEKTFYIDKYYLSRLFKKHTGSNIHEYILYKRISKAKRLLSEGYNITDTSIMCGFNDYSNFYRMFKKTVGVSPSHYKKNTAFKL